MRSSKRYVAVLVVLLTFTVVPAHAAPIPDDYIKGYAAAILAREFRVRAPSLQVTGGIIRLAESDLASVYRPVRSGRHPLGRRGCLARLVILGDRAPAETPVPRSLDASIAHDAGPARLLDTGLLPGGLLFRPLLADPRWPHFSLGYRQYFDEDDFDAVVAGTIGARACPSTAGPRCATSSGRSAASPS